MNNREIDALVAENVMGWTNVHFNGPLDRFSNHWYGRPPNQTWATEPPCYSTDIAAAWQVVGRMHEQEAYWSAAYKAGLWTNNFDRFGYEVEFRGKPTGSTAIEILAGYPRFISCAGTLPLAICLAALKAVGIDVSAWEKEE